MRIGRFAMTVAIATALTAGGAVAQQATSIDIPFESYRLANGLTVIMSVDRTTPPSSDLV